jgi:DNA-binding Xre family transcriptional regulator
MKVRIREVAESKGIKSARQLQKATGVGLATAAKWFQNDLISIRIDSLNLLCNKLKCTPSDLLVSEKV